MISCSATNFFRASISCCQPFVAERTTDGWVNPSACHLRQPRTAQAKMPGHSARSLLWQVRVALAGGES